MWINYSLLISLRTERVPHLPVAALNLAFAVDKLCVAPHYPVHAITVVLLVHLLHQLLQVVNPWHDLSSCLVEIVVRLCAIELCVVAVWAILHFIRIENPGHIR